MPIIMAKVLLLIDIQNEYFPGGKMELVGTQHLSQNAGRLLQLCRKQGIPAIHIQHISTRSNAPAFHPGSAGVNIHASVAPVAGEPVLQKNYANSFRQTRLHETLQAMNATELIICGAMSHMCIDTTVRAAFDLGYKCTVVQDACATRDLEFNGQRIEAEKVHAAFMAALGYIFAEIVSLQQFDSA
jgi:nicotinamidase-related amidase